jgi:hypothetical protein
MREQPASRRAGGPDTPRDLDEIKADQHRLSYRYAAEVARWLLDVTAAKA